MSQLKQNHLKHNPRSLIEDLPEEQASQITGGGTLELKHLPPSSFVMSSRSSRLVEEFEAEIQPYNSGVVFHFST
jgi:hypothetical protein